MAFCAGPGGLTHYHPSASAACELFEKAVGGAARRLFSGRPLADISVLYGNLLLPGMGAGNAFLAPFDTEDDRFTKTGSGHT